MPVPATPDAILLATDLSARSDRALARALQLARQWQARLVVLVALPEDADFSLPNRARDAQAGPDAPPPETRAAYVARLAERDLQDAGVAVEVQVVVGAPGPAAAAAAREAGCGLVVAGTSRSTVAMRMDPGSTLRWLARHAPVPVLAVHDRPAGPYRHVSVASDYSPAAEAALQLADRWFGDAASRTLLHGYDVPLTTLALDDGPRAAALAQAQEQADGAARTHLAQTLGEGAGRWSALARLHGPVRLLREHAYEAGTDLTVIAAHGRSPLLDRLIGSVADRLLETVDTDLLVVRPART
jgi:nucleotide-binding universal stress UspA family protein